MEDDIVLKTFSITDVGKKRKLNQDYVFSMERMVGSLSNLFMVADGMGGHNAGEYASKVAIEMIYDSVMHTALENPILVLEEAIKKANLLLMKKGKEDKNLEGMGTTIVVATIKDNIMTIANVGDSRLYIMNNENGIKQITKDHSLVEEMVRIGGLAPDLARLHPDKNIITRALGVKKELAIDFFEVTLQKGEIVLMCSDGLTNMLEDEDIHMIMKGQRDIVEQAEELVKAANDNGGKDNIAIVLVEPFAEVE